MQPYRAVDIDGRTNDARLPGDQSLVPILGTYAEIRLGKPSPVD